MNELCRVALEVQRECEKRDWRFCFIGGLAVQHWGEPRFTRDVDLTLLTGFGGEETYIDPLLEVCQPRIEDCREFPLQNRVLLLKSAGGIGIDVALGALPFEEEAARRSRLIEVEPDAVLRLCSPEDRRIARIGRARNGRRVQQHGQHREGHRSRAEHGVANDPSAQGEEQIGTC